MPKIENSSCTNDSFIKARVKVYRHVGSFILTQSIQKRTWSFTAALAAACRLSPVACRVACSHSLAHSHTHSLTHSLTHTLSRTLTTLNSPWGKLRMIVADGSGGDCVVLIYCDEWVSERVGSQLHNEFRRFLVSCTISRRVLAFSPFSPKRVQYTVGTCHKAVQWYRGNFMPWNIP